MKFAFEEEQVLFRDSVRGLLERVCTPAVVREAWGDGDGRAPAVWHQLAEMGVLGMTLPEAFGGLGMNEIDQVLIFEETGRAGLPDPIVESVAAATPLLAEVGDDALKQRWLTAAASGEVVLGLGLEGSQYVLQRAPLYLLQHGDEVHAVEGEQVELTPVDSVDRSRRLFTYAWEPSDATKIATDVDALARAFDRAVVATAAQLVGVAAKLVQMTVEYVKVRNQFGRAIGTFQAVKHQLADANVAVSFARPAVYRAAWSIANVDPARACHASMAKVFAADAAKTASRVALQLHGAIGYTFEYDLMLWLKRAWALGAAYRDAAWHTERVAEAILS